MSLNLCRIIIFLLLHTVIGSFDLLRSGMLAHTDFNILHYKSSRLQSAEKGPGYLPIIGVLPYVILEGIAQHSIIR